MSVTRHQPCVTIGPGVGSISRRGHEHAPAVQLCVINLMNHLYLQHAKHSTSEMLLLAQPGQGHRAACFESDAD